MSAAVSVLFAKPSDRSNEADCRSGQTVAPDAAMTALAILSHDLRGPLANLSIALDSLREANEHGALDRIAVYANRAERASERMQEMLRTLLARVKAAGGPFEIRRQPVNVFDLVDNVIQGNLELARRSGVRLQIQGQSNASMMADASLLSHAVENLVNNAIRHSPTGGTVDCQVTLDHARSEVTIEVRDEGPGLHVQDATQHINPFLLSHTEDTPARHPAGLGLWIVAAIAERHGGTVDATNRTHGSGAQVTIHLPVTACRPTLLQESNS